MPRLLGVSGSVLSTVASWDDARRILCVRLDSVGDVLMTAPALRALKQARADRHVTLCTSAVGARVAPLIPDVDDVVVYDAPWMKATSAGAADAHRAAIARLREGAFDAAVIFTVYSQSPLPAALLCFEADIPRRLAHCRENPYQLLTDWIRESEPDRVQRHEVRRQLDLVASVGARTAQETIAVRLPPDSRRGMRGRLRAAGIAPGAGFIAMHPGASAPSRRYPADGFVAVGRTLAARGHRLVVVGTTDEGPLADAVARGIGPAAVSFAGRTTLVELAALLSLARVVVANNSGPMHLAAAVGTPTVALYALTNPQHTPWGTRARVLSHDVDCRWCQRSVCPAGHHACLRRVPPDAIVAAVDALQERPHRTLPAMEASG
jgi:lipopolysaccharide heptosyltransferase II